jgi:hypothetical protein
VPGAEIVMFPDLGHVTLLTSRRVSRAVIERLVEPAVVQPAAAGA